MMGDSEGPFTDRRRPPASQIGAVCNSSIKDSQVIIVNVINCFSVQYQSQPEQREPCTVQCPEDSGQRPKDAGQRPEDAGQRPEDAGQRPEDAGQRPEDAGQRPEDAGQRPEDAGQRPEDAGQRPEDAGQCPEEPGQRPEDAGQCPEDTVQRPEDAGQRPEDTGQRPEDPEQRPEDPGQQPDDTGQRLDDIGQRLDDTGQRLDDIGQRLDDIGQRLNDTGQRLDDTGQRPEDPGQRPEEDELDGDSDKHKELINSFSLSGSHERQRAGSIQDPICYSSDFDEIKFEDAKFATGWPMPTDYSCRIAPHSGEVRMHSSASLKLPQRLLQKFLKKSVVVCLIKDMVCVSKSSRKNAIDSVVDITKEPFLLNGNELTAGSLVIAVPPNKISLWQAVIDAMK